jgi:hypothetical protein
MNLEELQEALESIFELEDLSPNLNLTISKKNGEIVIHTGLCQDNNGELLNLDDEEAEYEEDTDFDDSFGSIIDEEDEEVENEDE